MKKLKQIVLIAMIATFSVTQTGCIGSFGLTNKVLEFNHGVGDKFVNEIVFLAFCIVPVYEVTVLVDALVLNSIEFWTGDKVISKNENGDDIEITKTKNGVKLKNLTSGDEISMLNDAETESIYLLQNNNKIKLVEYSSSNNTATLYLPNQQFKEVNLNEQNIAEIRTEINNVLNLAIK